MTKIAPPASRWIDRVPAWLFIAGAGLLACLSTLYFFCPRFYLWRGIELGLFDLASYPELNRAFVVLAQLNNPNVRIESPSNNVVEWRLLFPQLGHALGLSPAVFLSLTWVGCWAAAALIVAQMMRMLGDRVQAFCAALLACGSAWFFVSTAWLSYNDSWVVLGLAAVAFTRSRIVLAVTCLLVCWIDERFLLVLPTALALRTFMQPRDDSWLPSFALDLVTASAASTPYLLMRVVAYYNGSDPHTVAYLQERTTETFPFWRYVEGAWAGLRSNWFFIGTWAWLVTRTRPVWWSTTVLLGTLLSFVVVLKSAGDLHRSAAMFVIVAMGGIVMLHRAKPQLTAKALPILALLNLVLPAAHVITVFRIPIYGAFDEWERPERERPIQLTANYNNDVGLRLAQVKQTEEAIAYFDVALKLDPTFHTAIYNKAAVLTNAGRYPQAAALLDSALAKRPDWTEAYYLRARCRERMGNYHAALSDFERALQYAAPTGTARAEIEQSRDRLRAGIRN
jgi:hypothetical protein